MRIEREFKEVSTFLPRCLKTNITWNNKIIHLLIKSIYQAFCAKNEQIHNPIVKTKRLACMPHSILQLGRVHIELTEHFFSSRNVLHIVVLYWELPSPENIAIIS